MGYSKKSIQHSYERHGKDSNCRIIEICSRCGDKKLGREEHNWIKVPFTNSDIKVSGKRKCKDCGKFES